MSESMEAWRTVWRTLAPLLPTAGLEALERALAEDDPRLIQGATTQPPPLMCVQDWPCEGGCLISYPFAFDAEHDCGDKLTLTGEPGEMPKTATQNVSTRTVGETEEWFAKKCYEVDQALGEPAACRYLLNAYDDWPRQDMIRALLPEVRRELEGRKAVAP